MKAQNLLINKNDKKSKYRDEKIKKVKSSALGDGTEDDSDFTTSRATSLSASSHDIKLVTDESNNIRKSKSLSIKSDNKSDKKSDNSDNDNYS